MLYITMYSDIFAPERNVHLQENFSTMHHCQGGEVKIIKHLRILDTSEFALTVTTNQTLKQHMPFET